MNKLSTEKRAMIVRCLVEGNSIRATCRMTGAAKGTVLKLLVDLGTACSEYQDRNLRNLSCRRIEVDEIWSFCYAKDRNVPVGKAAMGTGSVWTWVALDAETKLVPSWLIGGRDVGAAHRFVSDLRDRLANRVQLTSDGLHAYLETVPYVFGYDIDYAILMKLYGPDGNPKKPEGKYSPGRCNGSRRQTIVGNPDKEHVSTFYVERQNLTMRMSMRRFTRLTNGFSKKVENLGHAVALHFMHYNYCRKHQTTNMTPAQAAGVADHQWTVEEIIGLLDKTDSN